MNVLRPTLRVGPTSLAATCAGSSRSAADSAPSPDPVDRLQTASLPGPLDSASLAGSDEARADSLGLPRHTLFLSTIPPIQGDFPPPPGDLQRPVLIVHGFNGSALDWFNMKNFLTSNPNNRFGATYHPGKEDDFRQAIRRDPAARVFTISLSKPHLPYRQLSPEVTQAIEILQQETGGGEVDVLCHSMGGLVTRHHLDSGHDGIRRLVMIATPNHGSLESDLALATDQMKLYSHYIPEAKTALRDLAIDTRFMGKENNPLLHGMNERWQLQNAKVQTTIIAGMGIPTPDWNWKLLSQGDGMVTARSAYMPNTEFVVTQVEKPSGIVPDNHGNSGERLFTFKYNHGSLVSEPSVLQYVGTVLTRPDPAASAGASPGAGGEGGPGPAGSGGATGPADSTAVPVVLPVSCGISP